MVHEFPFGTLRPEKQDYRLPFVRKTRLFRGEFKWNGSFRWNVFGNKVIPSEVFFFSLLPEFPEISIPFVHNYQCQAISEKTAMPMTADLSDESLLFQIVRDVTVVLFSRLLSTDFLQHNCSTQVEKDLSFGRRFLCLTFAFMIRAFELNGAGKHLHPKLRIK